MIPTIKYWGFFEATSISGGTVEEDRATDVKEKNISIDESMSVSEGNKDTSLHEIKNLKGFKIASLNINSHLRYIDEFRMTIPNLEVDVLAINETKIDHFDTDSEIKIPGYDVIRRDYNRFGVEVVVYIREVYSFSERKDLNLDCLEMICIEISKQRSR